MMTAFQAILEHPELAVQVRCIEIRSLPANKYQTVFLSECTRTIDMCTNLCSFKCTVPVFPEILPHLLDKEHLNALRIPGKLNTSEAETLSRINGLDSLAIDQGSWNIIDVLPRWARSLNRNLQELILFMTDQVNEDVLESIVRHLPNLRNLHVIGCPQIDHTCILRLIKYLPSLESLSLSASDSTCPIDDGDRLPNLPKLRHIAFDTRYSKSRPPAVDALHLVLECLQDVAPCLSSFVIRLSDKKTVVDYDFLKKSLKQHRRTLREITFLDCSLGLKHITMICKNCTKLERLELPIPLKELNLFASALSRSSTLQSIIDTQTSHGSYKSLTPQNVRYLMETVPSLREVVSDRRVWKVCLSRFTPLGTYDLFDIRVITIN
ncbi:hypothetical protein VKT23_015186 [Stygiomarasmius scandens]|uniref:Uncharacterized protein n=1 Tax=Marasmiellus scandens TaxID=2682957 RepID=A0ABR1J1H4_9AGAR